MQEKGLFTGTFLVHESLFKSLFCGVREALQEFGNDPRQFLIDSIRGSGNEGRRKTLFRLGLALGLLFYAGAFLATVVLWSVAASRPDPRGALTWTRVALRNPEAGRAPVVQGPKNDSLSSGGGGGGNNSGRPPSAGQPPISSLVLPLIAPTTTPQLHLPELPVPETLLVDPRLQPQRKGDLEGMSNGAIGPPSDGPGSEHGIGSGRGGGIGNGPGRGLGEGEDWNTGGRKPRLVGAPSVSDHTRVDSGPVALNRPRPNYTETARKNRVQGLVRATVLVGADGSVQQVLVKRGLPDGLDGEAIAAAYQIRFRAATKSGQPIACWVDVEIEFNLR
jgi:TonB family protein